MSREAEVLNLPMLPLRGTNLVEAGAGTGKTYVITYLYLRLILEQRLTVPEVLVVTYTKAATAELKERIRSRLVGFSALLEGVDNPGTDPLLQTLVEKVTDKKEAARRLKYALLDFDRAAIYTIHGFCQRVLSDTAFECGAHFQVELITDQVPLLEEIADDFWRVNIQNTSKAFASYLVEKQITPDSFIPFLLRYTGKPYLEVSTDPMPLEIDRLEEQRLSVFAEASRLWQSQRESITRALVDNPDLDRRVYSRATLQEILVNLDAYLDGKQDMPSNRLEKLASRSLGDGTRKGKTSPKHEFFDVCERLVDIRTLLEESCDRALRALRGRLIEYANEELRRRKTRRFVQSFDDLLIDVNRALRDSGGDGLVRLLRSRYRAALIDEFQDTDPVQWGVFERIYATTGQPLFLVGDPKQSIYSFRGADIFAYLQARRLADNRYTLTRNWRSVPTLISAVNALFDQGPSSFVFPEIPFVPAIPAYQSEIRLKISGESENEALRVWLLPGGEKPLNKSDAEKQASRAVAIEIASLLQKSRQGKAAIGDRSLQSRDIAVLVRTHRQGRIIQDELLELGIHSVQRAQASVFETLEAEELLCLLQAVLEPARENLVRAALCTDMLGWNGNDLYALGENSARFDNEMGLFRSYHEMWRTLGCMRMLRHLITERSVMARLVAYPDGERRITNLTHLSELLHRRESESRVGMEGLLRWLSHQRQASDRSAEEAQLRLESDENLVQILTIHKSKGLQYGVVFCPFLFADRVTSRVSESLHFHDPEREYRPVLSLHTEHHQNAVDGARREELAENLRLLYVALTRAQHRCYLVWGRIRDAGYSSLAWLLEPPDDAGGDILHGMKGRYAKLGQMGLELRLRTLRERSGGSIAILEPPSADILALKAENKEPAGLALRRFDQSLDQISRVTSFSSLHSDSRIGIQADYDALFMATKHDLKIGKASSIFGFPRGSRAGSCLHAVFESLDFCQVEQPVLQKTVADALMRYGFSESWTTVISVMVEQVLDTRLHQEDDLRLRLISTDQRLAELEFFYPIGRINGRELSKLVRRHDPTIPSVIADRLESLTFNDVAGFMRGFIDLVFSWRNRFFIVDYKSNWLGDDIDGYAAINLPSVIASEAYYLQYLIYSVALHRYLNQRLPEYDYDAHFGGVFYLFLRGMSPQTGPNSGVYRDRPPKSLIETVDAYFAGDDAGMSRRSK